LIIKEQFLGQRFWATILSFAVLISILFLNISKTKSELLLASNFAIYDQLKHLVPDNTEVGMLIPFGQDAHGFVPTPKKVSSIIDAKHFFYVSKGMDYWIKDLPHLKESVNSTDLSGDINWISVDSDENHDEDEHTHHHDEDGVDPHYWLSIDNQMKLVPVIRDKMYTIFPTYVEVIKSKSEKYMKSLQDLKAQYNQTFTSCKERKFYVTHDAFSYLKVENNLLTHAILGISPESSPSAKAIKETITSLKESKVKTIFFESFISDKTAMAVAKELDISVDVLETLATISSKQAKNDTTYKALMLNNLHKIQKALQCR
jgi:zinc transport system substrate-binding protein